MILVDKPYISEFFKKTVIDNSFPVVDTGTARIFGFGQGTEFVDETQAIEYAK